MAHKKGQGSTRNGRDSNPKYLGVKRYDGETVTVGQTTIVGPLNVPSLLGEHASELYAKNQYNLIELFLKDKAITIDWNDEVLAKSCLTHAGEIKNEAAAKAVVG